MDALSFAAGFFTSIAVLLAATFAASWWFVE